MRIAILGAGFAGLSIAYQLSHYSHEIHLYDPKPTSLRASSRAFLLHPFIHPKSILNWNGYEAFEAAKNQMLELQSQHKTLFCVNRPFLKLANHPKLIEPFKNAQQLYPEIEWCDQTAFGHPGLWVHKAYQVQANTYIDALEEGAIRLGVKLYKGRPNCLKPYDTVIYACGDQAQNLFPFLLRKYTQIKGQVLFLKYPPHLELDHAISAYKCHVIPAFDKSSLLVASTYEREFENEKPDLEIAAKELLPKLNFLPYTWTKEDVVSVRSGIRFYAPDKFPKIGMLDEKNWIITGLGSKGLLYHAYLAKLLCRCLADHSTEPLPQKIKFNPQECLLLDEAHLH